MGPARRGRGSVKCRKKAGRFPTLQLVRAVNEASGTHRRNVNGSNYGNRLEINREKMCCYAVTWFCDINVLIS